MEQFGDCAASGPSAAAAQTWNAWEFGKGDQELRVRVNGQLTFSSSFPMIDAALRGYGIALVPEDLALPHIRSGALRQVLDDWCQPFPGYCIYYPSRRQTLPAFKLIIDSLRQVAAPS